MQNYFVQLFKVKNCRCVVFFGSFVMKFLTEVRISLPAAFPLYQYNFKLNATDICTLVLSITYAHVRRKTEGDKKRVANERA